MIKKKENKMLKIYLRRSCTSSRKAIKWFDKHNMDREIRKVERITQTDLLHVLSHTDEGIFALVKNPKKLQGELMIQFNILEKLSFNQAIIFLQRHPKLLRTPIILNEKKILIGYNKEEIRQFFPKNYREYSRNSSRKEEEYD